MLIPTISKPNRGATKQGCSADDSPTSAASPTTSKVAHARLPRAEQPGPVATQSLPSPHFPHQPPSVEGAFLLVSKLMMRTVSIITGVMYAINQLG